MLKKANRFLAVLLAVVMVVGLLPAATFAVEPALTIDTAEQFRAFAAAVNAGDDFKDKTVLLTADLALGGEGNPWVPVGTASAPFSGTFDGQGHMVSGLYVASGSDIGLFGLVRTGAVKNITVQGSVTGASDVGGVVGKLSNGTVANCGNHADVSGGSAVGGIVGYVDGDSTVSSSYNAGHISSTTGYIGGISGQHWRKGKVENCYNVGVITGQATVGGISGGHKAASPSLVNCYHAGEIDSNGSTNNIGAVLGAGKGAAATICYFITGTGSNEKDGVTETDKLSASALGDAFTDGEDSPVLTWESKISQAKPVYPAYVENNEASALTAKYIRQAVNSTKEHSKISAGKSLLGSSGYLSGASSTATDWMAMAMGRFGYFTPSGEYMYLIDDGEGYTDYLDAMKAYMEKTYAENNGILHSVKATEWHRAVMAIVALGGDPTAFGTYNGKPINLIADGIYNCVLPKGPGGQGINGWIWGLIAMDVGAFEVPADAKYTRADYITEILKMQLTDGVGGNEYGGWVLGGYGVSSDVDITAMAMQALAPYYNDDTAYTYVNENSKKEVTKTVRQCVDEAVARLSSMLNDDGGFASWNTNNVESISQVVVALTALGINPDKDEGLSVLPENR